MAGTAVAGSVEYFRDAARDLRPRVSRQHRAPGLVAATAPLRVIVDRAHQRRRHRVGVVAGDYPPGATVVDDPLRADRSRGNGREAACHALDQGLTELLADGG